MRQEMLKQKAIQEEEAKKLQSQVSERDQIIFNLDVAIAKSEKAVQVKSVTGGRRMVMSRQEKMAQVVTNKDDGSLSHSLFKAKDGQARQFKDDAIFKRWVSKHTRLCKEDLKGKLTPQQFYLT